MKLFKRKKEEMQAVKIDEASAYQADRRGVRYDRRNFGPPSEFPLVDSDKKMIQQDRRSRPERRLSNIVVTESKIKLNSKVLSIK